MHTTTQTREPLLETPKPDDIEVRPLHEHRPLPLLVTPGRPQSAGNLVDWIRARRDELRERLTRHGALLFRGFAVDDPHAFERVARAIDDDLKNEYLGTSPRDGLTDYVFSASELPGVYMIPQHCEMTFVKEPPRWLFFCCLTPPMRGGETPIADARHVLADLDPAVRRRFEERGLRISRTYRGPGSGTNLDPWKLKRWDQMFQTTDRDAVEARAREEGFDVEWLGGDQLRLVHTQPAVQHHPSTGEAAWFNHMQVFHASTGPAELRRSWQLRHDPRDFVLGRLAGAAVRLRRRLIGPMPLECTYADGTEIPPADVEHVRDVIWRNMVVFRWQQGDVLALDNRAASHGRTPYYGDRVVAVCWS